MFKNYFKVAFRNLLRNKAFSIINISGLAVGMASAILILLWIQNEVSYDQFHANKDRIYEVWNRSFHNDQINCWSVTPKVLAKTIQKDFPEVEHTARIDWGSNFLFSIGEKRITEQGQADTCIVIFLFSS
jgi:putative ABC transport system permease protein